MEEIKEKSAKKPVSMRLTATASERLMHIIDLYKNLEDPKGEQQDRRRAQHEARGLARGVRHGSGAP